MEQPIEPTNPGWYSAPDNPSMVRFWDGELWTSRLRPAFGSGIGTGYMVGPDHFVQASPLIRDLLNDGEELEAGYRGVNPNTLRITYVVATDQRVLVIPIKMIRRRRPKEVHSFGYDQIDTIGVVQGPAGGVHAVLTSGTNSVYIPTHQSLQSFVGWVQAKVNRGKDQVDLRALPRPRADAQPQEEPDDGLVPAVGAAGTHSPTVIGVADELRKLADLRNDGILSDDEFEMQKQRLLGS